MERDSSSTDPSMVTFDEEKRRGKLTAAEEPTPEEVDTQDWVPENLIVEARRLGDGVTTKYYTCHVVIAMFLMAEEVMKRVNKGRATCRDKETLQGKYSWIPEGWTMEIRAGGEGRKKMFKFFVHKSSGMRVSSKQDVLVFEEIAGETKVPATRLPFKEPVLLFEEVVKKRKVSRGIADTECDTSSEDNMLAKLDFYTSRVSAGWVKETIFRKGSQGVKKDLYFTDPVSHLVFRTKKSAEQYFWTAKNREDGCWPTLSVKDKYFSDKCKDMPGERCLYHQYEPEEERPRSERTIENEATTSSQVSLVASNRGQEEYREEY